MAIFIPRFLRHLRDVDTTGVADGDALTYDSGTGTWIPGAGGGGGPPTGAAGGVLSGTYPNPGFASDMATQAELDAHVNDATDAHDASAISFTPAGSIGATDVQAAIEEAVSEAVTGAPTTADYLVGTTQGGLSAEIVVGTSPGGELGGTWASPTVDATHSGSSHASVQSAAEATAAAALSAHQADTTAIHGIVDTAALVVDGDAAGGVLSGTYPNPGFAADMATQAELDAIAAGAVILAPASSARNVIQPIAGSVIAEIVRAHAAQSVDIWNVQKSDGGKYVRVGATGAVGIGDGGTYDPAAYGPYLTHVVLSAAGDGLYDANAGAPFTPGTDFGTVQLLLDGELIPSINLGASTENYGIGGSLRLSGTKNMGINRGKFYEVVHLGTKPSGTGAQVVAMTGGYASAFSDVASTGDVSRIRGQHSFAEHGGSGQLLIALIGHTVASYQSSTAAFPGSHYGADIDTGVLAVSGAAMPVVTGVRVQTYSSGRAVTLMKGIDILNVGQHANVVTSYGLYMAAQSGSTNVYGIYVAGGKSVFVDSLITGKIALPADADFANGQGAWWWDQANSLPKWKGKTSGGAVVNVTPYTVGGTDVALADGGTGASLVDPNADRIMFWDDSAGAVTWLTAGTGLTITGTTIDAAASGAPSTATYITQTADAGLSAEQALSGLATGLVKNTTGTGVLSIGAEGTDYYGPGGTDIPVTDGGTGASTAAGARTNLDVPSNAEAILDAIIDAKGDLLAGTAADTVARVAVGATNGLGLKVNSGATPGLEWGPLNVPRRYKSGLYYVTPQAASGDSTTAPTKDRTTYFAFPVYQDISIDRISLGVAVAGTSGAKVRLGIYLDNGQGQPSTLVLDAGVINGDSNTYQEITISPAQALVANTLYWIAVCWQVQTVASGTLRATAIGGGSEWVGAAANSADARVAAYQETGITGAFATAVPAASGITQVPSVRVRIV